MTGLTLDLAARAASLSRADIPDDVITWAKHCMLDTIGCAIGAYQAGPSQIAIRLAQRVTGTPPSTTLVKNESLLTPDEK